MDFAVLNTRSLADHRAFSAGCVSGQAFPFLFHQVTEIIRGKTKFVCTILHSRHPSMLAGIRGEILIQKVLERANRS